MELISTESGNRFPVKNVDDEATFKGYSFIKKWETICKNTDPLNQEDKLAEIFLENPALYYAYDIFLKPSSDHCKASIEARILARQPSEEIAQVLSLANARVVDWYEALFFNVRDRIDSVDYISKQVIGPVIGTGISNVRAELSAKFFGYFGGLAMLEFALNGTDLSIPRPQAGQSIDAYADAMFNSIIRSRSMTTAMSMELDTYKVMPLLELHAKLIEEHNKASLNAGPKNQLEETVAALLMSVPWSVGQSRENMLKDSSLGSYVGNAVEPRTADLLLLSSGKTSDQLEHVKEKKLPPPRKKGETDEHAK
jgi:hypothetical protein